MVIVDCTPLTSLYQFGNGHITPVYLFFQNHELDMIFKPQMTSELDQRKSVDFRGTFRDQFFLVNVLVLNTTLTARDNLIVVASIVLIKTLFLAARF